MVLEKFSFFWFWLWNFQWPTTIEKINEYNYYCNIRSCFVSIHSFFNTKAISVWIHNVWSFTFFVMSCDKNVISKIWMSTISGIITALWYFYFFRCALKQIYYTINEYKILTLKKETSVLFAGSVLFFPISGIIEK